MPLLVYKLYALTMKLVTNFRMHLPPVLVVLCVVVGLVIVTMAGCCVVPMSYFVLPLARHFLALRPSTFWLSVSLFFFLGLRNAGSFPCTWDVSHG